MPCELKGMAMRPVRSISAEKPVLAAINVGRRFSIARNTPHTRWKSNKLEPQNQPSLVIVTSASGASPRSMSSPTGARNRSSRRELCRRQPIFRKTCCGSRRSRSRPRSTHGRRTAHHAFSPPRSMPPATRSPTARAVRAKPKPISFACPHISRRRAARLGHSDTIRHLLDASRTVAGP